MHVHARNVICLFCLTFLVSADSARAQQPATTIAPILIPLTGTLTSTTGDPRTGTMVLTIAVYPDREASVPIWHEEQLVTLDARGGYAVQFGATRQEGLPAEVFADGAPRWIGVAVQSEPEQPRVMLLSVPYAAKAASADTLGGRPASDYVLSSTLTDGVRAALSESTVTVAPEGEFETMMAMEGSGTVNRVAKFVTTTTVGDSTITELSGNVGIGTTNPGEKLEIQGSLKVGNAAVTTAGLALTRRSNGLVANAHEFIGLDNSATYHKIWGGTWTGTQAGTLLTNNYTPYQISLAHPNTAVAKITFGFVDTTTPFNASNMVSRLVIQANGNVGIGTATPSSRLDVAGNVTVTGDMTVNGNIGAKYQDVAEWVDAASELEPGTVVVIDRSTTNRVQASARAYDARVAGAVSAQPGIVLGEPGEGRELVAQSGRVRIKVDARHGAIRPGDLLVTSPTPGHAMRSRPVNIGGTHVHRPGTLVGKALEALPKGKGEILVLLTLQ